jgi:hypothetical protein
VKFLQGIADSVALGAPPPGFTVLFSCDVIKMEIHFFKFHALYFLLPELCGDNEFFGNNSQHECVCDMSNLPITLKRKARPILQQHYNSPYSYSYSKR